MEDKKDYIPNTPEDLQSLREAIDDFETSQPRQISRRQFLKWLGIGAASVVVAGGAAKGAVELTRRIEEAQQSSQRTETILGEATETPKVFVIGNTAIDFETVNFRSSPEVIKDDLGRNVNAIDKYKVILNGKQIPEDAKTMFIENGPLIDGKDDNGRWFVIKADNFGDVFINFDSNRQNGFIRTEPNETGEIGFIETEKITVPIGQMGRLSFSTTPFAQAGK